MLTNYYTLQALVRTWALELAAERIGYEAFVAEPAAREMPDGRRRGIGIVSYVEGTGIGPYEGARVTIESSGRVRLATGVGTQGQGHMTSFAQIVAEQLGVDTDEVDVSTGDTRDFNWGTGTFASRGTVVAGTACHQAAVKVREKTLALAGEALGAAAEEVELGGGVAFVRDEPGRSIALGELARRANPLRGAVAGGMEPGLEATAYFGPSRGSTASGVHACVVEVDPETAEVRVVRYLVVHDCGTIVNPVIVDGQVHGGVAQRQCREAGEGVDVPLVVAEVEAQATAGAQPVDQRRGLPRGSDLHHGVEVAQVGPERAEQERQEPVPLEAPAPRALGTGASVRAWAELAGHPGPACGAVGLVHVVARTGHAVHASPPRPRRAVPRRIVGPGSSDA